MKTNMKRLCVGLLASMMLLSGCVGAGRSASTGAHQGTVPVSGVNEFPIVEEPIELAVYMQKPTGMGELETHPVTKWYEEKTNIKVKWDLVSGDVRQSLNIKLASDDYSDIFLGFGFAKSEQTAYYDQGVIIELSDLVDKHGYYIKELFNEMPEVEKELRHSKNMLLGIAGYSGNFESETPNKMWIYQPWMDKLGLETPTTTDEFYNVLKAFKEKDPNGNGKADEIPLGTRGTRGTETGLDLYLMNAFLPWGKYGFTNIDGKAVFAPVQDAAREGMRYIKKLYDEGLVHTESLVMDRGRITAIAENEVPILGASTGRWTSQFTAAGASNRMNEYLAVPPLKGPNGVQLTKGSGGVKGTTSFNITTDCEEPAAALKWVDYMLSDEAYELMRMPSNKRRANEGEIGLDGEQALWVLEDVETDVTEESPKWKFGIGYTSIEDTIKIKDYTIDGPRLQNSYYAYLAYEPYKQYGVIIDDFPMPSEIAEEYLDLRANFIAAVDSGFANFVIGEKDLDADWDAYVANFEYLGLERYTEIVQDYLDTLK